MAIPAANVPSEGFSVQSVSSPCLLHGCTLHKGELQSRVVAPKGLRRRVEKSVRSALQNTVIRVSRSRYLILFCLVYFSVFSVVNGFTEIKKTTKAKCEKHLEWSRQDPRTSNFKLHRTLCNRSPPKF